VPADPTHASTGSNGRADDGNRTGDGSEPRGQHGGDRRGNEGEPRGQDRGDGGNRAGRSASRRPRKAVLLRLDPAVHDALASWAADDLRSLNAHVEWLLRQALSEVGRMPRNAASPRPRGRPRREDTSGPG
jgi:hypothetical protein